MKVLLDPKKFVLFTVLSVFSILLYVSPINAQNAQEQLLGSIEHQRIVDTSAKNKRIKKSNSELYSQEEVNNQNALYRARIEAELDGNFQLAKRLSRLIQQNNQTRLEQEQKRLSPPSSSKVYRGISSIQSKEIGSRVVPRTELVAEAASFPKTAQTFRPRTSKYFAEVALQVLGSEYLWMLLIAIVFAYLVKKNLAEPQLVEANLHTLGEKEFYDGDKSIAKRIAEDPDFHSTERKVETTWIANPKQPGHFLTDQSRSKAKVIPFHLPRLVKSTRNELVLQPTRVEDYRKSEGNFIVFDIPRQAWVVVRRRQNPDSTVILAELLSQSVVSGSFLDTSMDASQNYRLVDGIHWKPTQEHPRLLLNLKGEELRFGVELK